MINRFINANFTIHWGGARPSILYCNHYWTGKIKKIKKKKQLKDLCSSSWRPDLPDGLTLTLTLTRAAVAVHTLLPHLNDAVLIVAHLCTPPFPPLQRCSACCIHVQWRCMTAEAASLQRVYRAAVMRRRDRGNRGNADHWYRYGAWWSWTCVNGKIHWVEELRIENSSGLTAIAGRVKGWELVLWQCTHRTCTIIVLLLTFICTVILYTVITLGKGAVPEEYSPSFSYCRMNPTKWQTALSLTLTPSQY